MRLPSSLRCLGASALRSVITSTHNPRVAAARRLRRSRERRATGRTTVDGPLLLAEALDNDIEIIDVFASPDDTTTAALCDAAGVALTLATPGIVATLAGTVNPRGPVAVITIPQPEQLAQRDTVVLWELADPGNAGTIIRSAAAFGFQVAATNRTVDVWSPKVLRAAMGGHFRTRPVDGLPAAGVHFASRGLRLVAAVRTGGEKPEEVLGDAEPTAIVVGNEAHGLPAELLHASDVVQVSIPMPGGSESLNAAVAASILMYLRSRR
jgi:TrmH family RNA methyltransferase